MPLTGDVAYSVPRCAVTLLWRRIALQTREMSCERGLDVRTAPHVRAAERDRAPSSSPTIEGVRRGSILALPDWPVDAADGVRE